MQVNHEHWLDALHLASASLPIGGFAYSQGLEQACQMSIVCDAGSAKRWIGDYLMYVVARQEMPWWLAVYAGVCQRQWEAVTSYTENLQALRETAELRLESRQMAHAMVQLYGQWLGDGSEANSISMSSVPPHALEAVRDDYTAAHALLCAARGLPAEVAMAAWLWSWLDNQVLAAVKLVPLGQRDGQQLLHALKPKVLQAITVALDTPVCSAGSVPIGLCIASARHETQYARLFRS